LTRGRGTLKIVLEPKGFDKKDLGYLKGCPEPVNNKKTKHTRQTSIQSASKEQFKKICCTISATNRPPARALISIGEKVKKENKASPQ
jgi:hypothetical protein